MVKGAEAVVAGHICLDIIPSISNPRLVFLPGRVFEIGPAILSTGGPVSNTGLALHKLGIRTRLMGKVGSDVFGQVIKQLITSHGPHLAEGMIEVRGEISSYTMIISPPDTDRMFLHCPGCNNTFTADDVDCSLLAGARLLHFGYPPVMQRLIANDGTELIRVLRMAKETGITTSLDMCMPDPEGFSGHADWWKILTRTLPYVDIFLPSLEETLFMLYPGRLGELVQKGSEIASLCSPELLASISTKLLSMGPAMVGLKLGSMGLYLRTSNPMTPAITGRACPPDPELWAKREIWSPCFETVVVGTTGAGDTTIAGFLAAFLRGKPPEECATTACAVGACNVECADALGGLRSWEETQARVDAGWARKSTPAAPDGWRICRKTGVWYSPADSIGFGSTQKS